MRIEAATEATQELLEALTALLPQLNPKLKPLTMERLSSVIGDPATTLLVMSDGGRCIEVARERGAEIVELQSARWREVANRLYPRMGFQLRESNLYRLEL